MSQVVRGEKISQISQAQTNIDKLSQVRLITEKFWSKVSPLKEKQEKIFMISQSYCRYAEVRSQKSEVLIGKAFRIL
ncbi:MAG: hypothetical protein F6K17_08380 [Okeania sp. SIO3C4]|nr:hypothetical protein [Okeania sp. SIO3C4]